MSNKCRKLEVRFCCWPEPQKRTTWLWYYGVCNLQRNVQIHSMHMPQFWRVHPAIVKFDKQASTHARNQAGNRPATQRPSDPATQPATGTTNNNKADFACPELRRCPCFLSGEYHSGSYSRTDLFWNEIAWASACKRCHHELRRGRQH